jgi:hypothetical protein
MLRCGLAILIACLPSIAAAQNRIEQIRQDVTAPTSPSPGSTSPESACSWYDTDELMESLFPMVALAPFYIPHALMRDNLENTGYFPWHPYPSCSSTDNMPAFLWCGGSPGSDSPWGLPKRNWGLRILGEDGNDFRGLNRAGVRFTFDTSTRWGVQSNWNFLSESLFNGNHDTTTLGDTNLTYRFAQCGNVQMHTGLGFRVLTDPHVTDWGFNFLYGIDYFPVKPVVFSSVFDSGTLGSAGVVHVRTTIGVTHKHLELLTGYDFMRIGSVNVLGPLIGLRLWF